CGFFQCKVFRQRDCAFKRVTPLLQSFNEELREFNRTDLLVRNKVCELRYGVECEFIPVLWQFRHWKFPFDGLLIRWNPFSIWKRIECKRKRNIVCRQSAMHRFEERELVLEATHHRVSFRLRKVKI